MAKKINYEDDDLITNPFAFAAQAPAAAASAPLTTTNATTEAYNAAQTDSKRALAMAVKREPLDLRYDVNKDGKVTSADALSLAKGTPIRFDIDAFGVKPTTTDVGALSTNRVTDSAAPVAAYQAPTAREIRDGVGKDGQVSPLSQTQGYGMVPVYQEPQGRGAEREGQERVLLGYEFNPIAAGLTTVDVPKPAAILAEEKRLGKTMEATYATFTAPQEGSDRGNRESIAYGPPIGYRYDNGQGQYVKFYSDGNYYETEQRKGEYDDALKMAALFAAIATGGASLGLGEAAGAGAAGGASAAGGAGLLGAEGATAAFVPGEIAALNTGGGLTVGGAGAAGMGGGAGLTAALGTDLAAGGLLTAGNTGLAAMGGAAGLTALPSLSTLAGAPLAAAGTGLAAMGGGAGLTAAGAGGGAVNAGLLGETAVLGAGEGLTTGGAGASGMGGGTGLTATLSTDLAGGGALTAGNAGLASMGGGAGLTALSNIGASAGAPLTAAGLGLTSMGGGTGLTTAAAGGGTVGAGGVTPAGGTLVGSQGVISGGTGAGTVASSLPSLSTIRDALTVASLVSGAVGNNNASTTAPFTMAPYVPPSGKPFANIAMSPIATPYTPTRILGQYDPTMTPGGVSPYELIMAQMQAPQNLYADFEAGTNIGGFDPQRFVTPAAPSNFKGGMIDKSRMVGPNPMGPDNGFASIQDGEFVMTRKATQKYGIELMNAINSGKISKGKLSGLLEA